MNARTILLAGTSALALMLAPALAHAGGFETYPSATQVNPGDYLILEQQPSPGVYTTVKATPTQLLNSAQVNLGTSVTGILGLANGGTGSATPFGTTSTTFARGDYVAKSLLSYGAKCDGTTDDTSALQTALNAGPVYKPDGLVCYINGAITVTGKNFVLYGSGGDSGASGGFLLGSSAGFTWNANALDYVYLNVHDLLFTMQAGARSGDLFTVENTGISGTSLTSQVSFRRNQFMGGSSSTHYRSVVTLLDAGNLDFSFNEFLGWNNGTGTYGLRLLCDDNAILSQCQTYRIDNNRMNGGQIDVYFLTTATTNTHGHFEGIHITNNLLIGAAQSLVIDQSSVIPVSSQPPGLFLIGNEIGGNGVAGASINYMSQIAIVGNSIGNAVGTGTPDGLHMINTGQSSVVGNYFTNISGQSGTALSFTATTGNSGRAQVSGNNFRQWATGVSFDSNAIQSTVEGNNYALVTTPVANASTSTTMVLSGPGTNFYWDNTGTTHPQTVVTGNGISTANVRIQIGGDRTDAGSSGLDLVSVSGNNADFHIGRNSGANGGASIVNGGTGSFCILTNATAGTAGSGGTNAMCADSAQNVTLGVPSLATTATNGYVYLPQCGTQTGTPTTETGFIPVCVDTTDSKVTFYSGGAWH